MQELRLGQVRAQLQGPQPVLLRRLPAVPEFSTSPPRPLLSLWKQGPRREAPREALPLSKLLLPDNRQRQLRERLYLRSSRPWRANY